MAESKAGVTESSEVLADLFAAAPPTHYARGSMVLSPYEDTGSIKWLEAGYVKSFYTELNGEENVRFVYRQNDILYFSSPGRNSMQDGLFYEALTPVCARVHCLEITFLRLSQTSRELTTQY